MTRRAVAMLVFPDFQILDAAGPIAAFEIAGRLAPGAYELQVVAATPGPVVSSSGAALMAGTLSQTPLDTLLVSGGDGTRPERLDPSVIALAAQASGQARRTASVCSGAFILAEAGLLEGRRATTHWSRTADFRRRFPKTLLEPDRIYVRDDPIWTSAGITAGIDLSLALIAEDLGEAIARATAQQLVAPRRRPGGQSQFSGLVEMGGATGRFEGLLNWAGQRLCEGLSVERLAEACAMSPRNFARAFVREVGMTPAKAVEHLRVQAARQRLEAGEPIDRVALAVGFGDAERMRRAVLRTYGQPPQALRRAARDQG
ncbi:MAG: GlxA family transcriptional regulator [Phenylobacterium sp.]|uniref:GlxA family transcriptional regulator n=1 Tax=Phenylobacterium sp. TaxID=1871053 RepID=UPI002727D0CA|nr:GlxA family transcriptional regulator [Phenylobacterium sp.]MDO8900945.1 GlxA family transcriptional regulator [Phenylobacterium sp.]